VNAPLRRSPVARQHARLGARVIARNGWEIVQAYEPEGEPWKAVAIADITARAKVDLRGRIDPLLAAIDGRVFAGRLREDWALVLAEPDRERELIEHLQVQLGRSAMVTDATHLLCGFAVAGPRVRELFGMATAWDPSTLSPDRVVGAPLVDVPALIVHRSFAVPCFEVYVGSEYGRYAWGELHALAERLGGGAAGWDALAAIGWR
jgi:glycine cleavage system aminomethyltransferase T